MKKIVSASLLAVLALSSFSCSKHDEKRKEKKCEKKEKKDSCRKCCK